MNQPIEPRPSGEPEVTVEVRNTPANPEVDFNFLVVNARQFLYGWRRMSGVADDQALETSVGEGDAQTQITSPRESVVTIVSDEQTILLDKGGLWLLEGEQRRELRPNDENVWLGQSVASLLFGLTQPSVEP